MAESPFAEDKAPVAVVTGGHAYDVPGFHRLVRTLPEIDAYVQPLEDFVADVAGCRDAYEAVCFYCMHRETPGPEAAVGKQGVCDAIEGLTRTGQGLLVLHHGLCAWPAWPFWSEVCGIADRGSPPYHFDQTVPVHVVDTDHRIPKTLIDFTLADETYEMPEPDADSEVVLTTDHPRSMRALGWTRQVGRSRVFCLQPGHGPAAWTHPGFRTVLQRGLLWCAGRI